MPLPPAFKTDESFLEKISMGAAATQRTFADLESQGHQPLELERGSMSFKVWKAIKIKRLRVPDILCLRCGHRVESRGKRKLEITMSHSMRLAARGWDAGLDDEDMVALVACERSGPRPIDWRASELVQYVPVRPLRDAFHADRVSLQRPKGAGEGFEVRITWPAAVAEENGIVEIADEGALVYRQEDGTRKRLRLGRKGGTLVPAVAVGEAVRRSQILAAVVPVLRTFPCAGGATIDSYLQLIASTAEADRYTAAKALGRFDEPAAAAALTERVRDGREHVYVRLEAAAGLMRRGSDEARAFFAATLQDDYLERRLEAVIVLGEVGTPEAAALLVATLASADQPSEIRAGAAWALGQVGGRDALPAIVESFDALDLGIRVEAARALARIARGHTPEVLQQFTASAPERRPGIAWAVSTAGVFRVADLLPALVDADARHWVAYILGTQEQTRLVAEIEDLSRQDPEVYFAVTVLWKIVSSWVYGLEEY